MEANFVDLLAQCVSPRQPTPVQPVPQPSPVHSASNIPGSAQPSFSLSGFTKYIKDTSNKVMQQMQQ